MGELKIWNRTSKIIPDLWLVDLFCPIKKRLPHSTLMPSLEQSCCHIAGENCVPLSEVRVAGTPHLATQEDMKAAAHMFAVISFSGTASSHLVVLSMMVRM